MNSFAFFNRDSDADGETSANACVLAIEPDPDQARILEQVLSRRITGRLIIVGSTEAALTALVDTIPDLVLVSPLLAPRTEEQLMAHLRALGVDAFHLQILSIPRFGDADASSGKKKPMRLQSLKKLAGGGTAAPSDAVAFANEVAAHLEQASHERHGDREAPAGPASASAAPSSSSFSGDESGGVRLEHIEQLMERLWDEAIEPPTSAPPAYEPPADDRPSPHTAAEAVAVEAIPEPDVMPMQTAHEPTGSAIHDANSPRLPRFLTLDDQISQSLRTLLEEADGCLKMSFFTGGGACAGRALDLLMSEQGIKGDDRSHNIQEIGKKHPAVADSFLRVLSLVMADPGGMWDAARLTLAVVILKAMAYEIYVLGPERTERATYVIGLLERFNSVSKGAA